MEEVPPARHGGVLRLVVPLAGIAVAVAALAWLAFHRAASVPLTVAGVPRVNLAVNVVDRAEAPNEASPSPPQPTETPTSVANSFWKPRPTPTLEPAERDESIDVTRVPIAVSAYVLDGGALLAWADENPSARAILDSALVQGMFQDILRILSIRGQDVRIPGIEGPFLDALARDVLSANAVVHYDPSRGRRGYVLAFERSRSSLASRLVPLIVAAVGKREYRAGGLDVSIIEAVLGPQRLFVTEHDGEIYLASSIGTLLNVIASGRLPPPASAHGTIAVTVRAEAWLRDLVPAMTGQRNFDLTWSVDLQQSAWPGQITTGPAEMFALLQPALAPAVVAAMPHDALAVVAAAIPFPHFEASEGSDRFAPDPGAKNAGIGVVWDLELTDKLRSQVGIAALARSDEEAPDLAALVSDRAFSDKCAGGSVLLAASSELLLTRMREACDGQSIGVLDRIPPEPGSEPPQIVFAVAPGEALVQVLGRGIGTAKQQRGDETPRNGADMPGWQASYDAAVENARLSATKTLTALPSAVFQGRATGQGAVLKGAFEPPRQLARQASR